MHQEINYFPHLSFQLSQEFVDSYIGRSIDWGPVGYITFKRTYSRRMQERHESYDPQRTEEWHECIQRVVNGVFSIQKDHCENAGLPWIESKANTTAEAMYDAMFNFKFLPPGRGLWMMGTRYVTERTGAALYNCSFISTENIDIEKGEIFEWIMDALMLGIGVGYDTLGAGKVTIPPVSPDTYTWLIQDSREGWVVSIRLLIDAYINGTAQPVFDYSAIREAGRAIRGFGGTSSGPDPLVLLHTTVRQLWNAKVGQAIDSELIVDTQNVIGRCVVAGNVRRSAAIAIGDPNDKVFTSLKNDQEKLYAWRWNSNNTITATPGMDYTELSQQCVINGEPGFHWLDNSRHYGRTLDGRGNFDVKVKGVNPCAEITLENRELCNLVEIFPAHLDSIDELVSIGKLAYLYNKSVTLTNTHWPKTNAVMLKNRRLGISQSGITQAIAKFGYRKFMENSSYLYSLIKSWDESYSDWLCIPRSKKLTTVKPSGSVSLLAGATPGMHYPESEYYIRRIRFANDNPMVADFTKMGYHVEPDAYGSNAMVVSFPVKERYFTKTKFDVTIWEQVKLCADLQKYWADNSVSVTVTFKEHEAAQIKPVLEAFDSELKTISFLKLSETGYIQAPYEAIDKAKYNEMLLSISDTSSMTLSSNEEGVGEKYCDSSGCVIKF